MTRFFVVKCPENCGVPIVLRDFEQLGIGVEVVEVVPEKRDLDWWKSATAHRALRAENP